VRRQCGAGFACSVFALHQSWHDVMSMWAYWDAFFDDLCNSVFIFSSQNYSETLLIFGFQLFSSFFLWFSDQKWLNGFGNF